MPLLLINVIVIGQNAQHRGILGPDDLEHHSTTYCNEVLAWKRDAAHLVES